MNLYDNAWPHTYEEIRRFYPVWYRDVLEMDAIWRAQGAELDGVREAITRIIFNNYIHTADAETISRYEKFLELAPDPSATLEERRECVAAAMFPTSHIGAPEIREIFGLFASGSIGVEFSAGIIDLIVDIADGNYLSVPAFLSILMRRIPAHLALRFTYQYSAGIKIKRIIDSWQYRVPECGTLRCGTWWMPHTLGWSEQHGLTVREKTEPITICPELSGTLPYIKTAGYSLRRVLRTGGQADAHPVQPQFTGLIRSGTEWLRRTLGWSEQAGTLTERARPEGFANAPELVGTLPEQSRKGYAFVCGAVRSGGVVTAFVDHPKEAGAPEKTGTWPEETVRGYTIAGELFTGARTEGIKIEPEYTGTLPEEAQHGERDD